MTLLFLMLQVKLVANYERLLLFAAEQERLHSRGHPTDIVMGLHGMTKAAADSIAVTGFQLKENVCANSMYYVTSALTC